MQAEKEALKEREQSTIGGAEESFSEQGKI